MLVLLIAAISIKAELEGKMLKEKLWFHETITETDILGVFLMASARLGLIETKPSSLFRFRTSQHAL